MTGRPSSRTWTRHWNWPGREGQAIAGYRSTLGVPLLRENTLIGVFSIVRTRVEPFASKDIDALYIATPPYFHPEHLEAAIAAQVDALDPGTCEHVLQALMQSHFLAQTRDGSFVLSASRT